MSLYEQPIRGSSVLCKPIEAKLWPISEHRGNCHSLSDWHTAGLIQGFLERAEALPTFFDLYYRETWPGSSLYSSRGPRTDMSQPGLEPGPPAWEASTLEKNHLDSLIFWLFGTSTPGRKSSSTGLPQCRCTAHELLSVEGKYSLLPNSFGLRLLPE